MTLFVNPTVLLSEHPAILKFSDLLEFFLLSKWSVIVIDRSIY